MELIEAEKIARIVGTADNGCSVCVGELVDQLNDAFPRFRWTATNEGDYPLRVVTVEPVTEDG